MLLVFFSLISVAVCSIDPNAGPESVMNMYVAKLRRYSPNRHLSDDTDLRAEVEKLIEDYNSRVPQGTLSEANDKYTLSIFGILCAMSIKNWDYEELKQCRKINDDSSARDFLKTLLKESST